jgi:xylose dehydrogenase (NAD/NADP)
VGLKLGLLSTANINRRILAASDDVVAVASRDVDRARAYARENGIERAHGSYEELLADPEVEAVYISLPNALHVDWAVRALEAGKHVLCEKPLARDPAEAERAFDAADRAGRVLMEAFMWRHTPQTVRLLELLPEIGDLRVIRSHFSFPQPAPGNVRLSASLDGGALMDVGCYCVSAARLIAGAEPEGFAGHRLGDEVDLAFAGTMRFPGDVLAHFDCAMNSAHRHELEVVGSEGTLLVRDPWHAREVGIELNGSRIDVDFADAYACELEELAAVAAGRPARFGRDDAVGQARAIAGLYAVAG